MTQEAVNVLRTAPQPARYCRRESCRKPLTGRQRDFCSFGTPDSCHRLYWSEVRRAGLRARDNEERDRNVYLFGKHPIFEKERLRLLVEAAKKVIR